MPTTKVSNYARSFLEAYRTVRHRRGKHGRRCSVLLLVSAVHYVVINIINSYSFSSRKLA